jgi:hypothetical protein
VDGKPIAASLVAVRDGVSYVDTATLAEALGTSVQSAEGGLTITAQPKPSRDCDNGLAQGQRVSEQFRKAVAGVAEEIESLRAVALKKDKSAIAPRFDQIDHELSLSTVHVQTDPDMGV